jgi:large subunit ribosomal protein L30
MADKTVKVTLIKSPISALKKHKACLIGLGLRKVRHTVEVEDTTKCPIWWKWLKRKPFLFAKHRKRT